MKVENREENQTRTEPIRSGNLFVVPTRAEWWQSSRYVFLIFTLLICLALAGSFVPYQRVIAEGHPWLPHRTCPGCPLCGMTRSFCAMSSGQWQVAEHWNRGGPPLYGLFWLWLLVGLTYCLIKGVLGTSGFLEQLSWISAKRQNY
jgi:hypothetical protein